VFDASCARIFLTKPNVADYVPRSLVILKALAEEQDAIAEGLRNDATTLRSRLPALPVLVEETAAAAFLVALGPKTDFAALEQFAQLSDAEALIGFSRGCRIGVRWPRARPMGTRMTTGEA
jgi:hypothetical protein